MLGWVLVMISPSSHAKGVRHITGTHDGRSGAVQGTSGRTCQERWPACCAFARVTASWPWNSRRVGVERPSFSSLLPLDEDGPAGRARRNCAGIPCRRQPLPSRWRRHRPAQGTEGTVTGRSAIAGRGTRAESEISARTGPRTSVQPRYC